MTLLPAPRLAPGLLGDVVALQARTYAEGWGFGPFFEAKLAREMAALGS